MTFDIPHMTATALTVLAASWIFQHITLIQRMRMGGRILVTFMMVFIPILSSTWSGHMARAHNGDTSKWDASSSELPASSSAS